MWDLKSHKAPKLEVLRQRFFPFYTGYTSLQRWWSIVRQRVQPWLDNHVLWRKALDITEAEAHLTYRAECLIMSAMATRPSNTSPRPAKKQCTQPPSSSSRREPQEIEVPLGHIKTSKCRNCRQAKVKDKNLTHPKLDCPHFPYKRKDKHPKDHGGITPIAHHMCASNLLVLYR